MNSKKHSGKNLNHIPILEQEVQVAKAVGENTAPANEGKLILIIGVVIIGILLLSFAGFKIYNHYNAPKVINIDQLQQDNLAGKLKEDEGYIYNGFSFVKADGLWWTQVKRFDTLVKVPLHFGPKEVEHIPLFGKLNPGFNNGTLYIAVNPNISFNKYYTLSLMEMNNNIVQGINRGIESACTFQDPVCGNRSIVSCANPQGRAVVELVVSDENSIELSGTCIKVSGSGSNLTKAADRLLYHWYGVLT